MRLSPLVRQAKLQALIDAEGFSSLEDLLRVAISDSVCPSICVMESCTYICDMEPDEDRGWCEACGSNTVQSALILAEVI